MLPSRMARWLSLCQASGCPQNLGLFNPSPDPTPSTTTTGLWITASYTTSVDANISSMCANERGHRIPCELRCLQVRTRHPPPELTHVLQPVPDTARRVTQLQEPYPEPIHPRAHAARLPPRPRHRSLLSVRGAPQGQLTAPPRWDYADPSARHSCEKPATIRSPTHPAPPCRHSSRLGIDRTPTGRCGRAAPRAGSADARPELRPTPSLTRPRRQAHLFPRRQAARPSPMETSNTRPRRTPPCSRATASGPASAGPATAGTTPWPRASSRPSSSTSCTGTAGRRVPRLGALSSSTSRLSTTASAAIRRSATSVRQTTNPPTLWRVRASKRVR